MIKILIILIIGYVVFEIVEHAIFPLVWLITKRRKKSLSGAPGMIGLVGEVKEWKRTEGKIFVHGELWNAASEASLSPGDKAVILEVDGLTLKIKPFNQ